MRRSMTTTHSSTSSSIDSSSNYHTLNPPPPLPNLSHQRSLSMETSSALPTDLSLALSVSGADFSQRQQGSADWPPIKTLLRRALTDNSPGSPSSSSSCRQMRQTVNNNTSGDNSLFVKVKMEGMKIGRKIDVLALDGYPHLITTLEKMFSTPSILWAEVEQYCDHKKYWSHVLTYEDQDGDWMMVGDVPWEMFLTTVKRLKITRTPSG